MSRLRWTLLAPLALAVVVGVALLLTADGGRDYRLPDALARLARHSRNSR